MQLLNPFIIKLLHPGHVLIWKKSISGVLNCFFLRATKGRRQLKDRCVSLGQMTTPVLCISMYIVADKGPNKYGLRTRIWPTGRHLRRPGLSSLRTSTLHGYHKHITWVSHAKHGYHMPPHEYHIPPHEYHMHTTWASHAHHMGITCHHIGITCTPHEYHMQKT